MEPSSIKSLKFAVWLPWVVCLFMGFGPMFSEAAVEAAPTYGRLSIPFVLAASVVYILLVRVGALEAALREKPSGEESKEPGKS